MMAGGGHLARAVGTSTGHAPKWRVELRAGAHHFVADEPATKGGGDTGPSPMALVLSGLAACTVTTLRMYADRKEWKLATIEVDVRYNVGDDEQSSINRTITIHPELDAEQIDRLTEIADRTPVTQAVRAGIPITTTVRTAAATA